MIAIRIALQLSRLGMVLGLLGAAVLAYGAGQVVLAGRAYDGASESSRRREKIAYAGAGILLFGAFALTLIATFAK